MQESTAPAAVEWCTKPSSQGLLQKWWVPCVYWSTYVFLFQQVITQSRVSAGSNTVVWTYTICCMYIPTADMLFVVY